MPRHECFVVLLISDFVVHFQLLCFMSFNIIYANETDMTDVNDSSSREIHAHGNVCFVGKKCNFARDL